MASLLSAFDFIALFSRIENCLCPVNCSLTIPGLEHDFPEKAFKVFKYKLPYQRFLFYEILW